MCDRVGQPIQGSRTLDHGRVCSDATHWNDQRRDIQTFVHLVFKCRLLVYGQIRDEGNGGILLDLGTGRNNQVVGQRRQVEHDGWNGLAAEWSAPRLPAWRKPVPAKWTRPMGQAGSGGCTTRRVRPAGKRKRQQGPSPKGLNKSSSACFRPEGWYPSGENSPPRAGDGRGRQSKKAQIDGGLAELDAQGIQGPVDKIEFNRAGVAAGSIPWKQWNKSKVLPARRMAKKIK